MYSLMLAWHAVEQIEQTVELLVILGAMMLM